jgi:hypothetical protein
VRLPPTDDVDFGRNARFDLERGFWRASNGSQNVLQGHVLDLFHLIQLSLLTLVYPHLNPVGENGDNADLVELA